MLPTTFHQEGFLQDNGHADNQGQEDHLRHDEDHDPAAFSSLLTTPSPQLSSRFPYIVVGPPPEEDSSSDAGGETCSSNQVVKKSKSPFAPRVTARNCQDSRILLVCSPLSPSMNDRLRLPDLPEAPDHTEDLPHFHLQPKHGFRSLYFRRVNFESSEMTV